MAVAHDASSESPVSVSESSFSWTHTPVGTPRGLLIFIGSEGPAAPHDTAVTYAGGAVSAVSGGLAADAAGEPLTVRTYFLGSSVPTGAQTVAVTRNDNNQRAWGVAITVTAAGDTEVTGIVLEQGDQAVTEENVDDGSPGTNSLRYMGIFSGKGLTTALTDGANSTRLHDSDLDATSRIGVVMRETTAGQGSRPVGVTGTSDDVAAVYLAIREVSGGGGFAGAGRIFGGISSPLSGLVVR